MSCLSSSSRRTRVRDPQRVAQEYETRTAKNRHIPPPLTYFLHFATKVISQIDAGINLASVSCLHLHVVLKAGVGLWKQRLAKYGLNGANDLWLKNFNRDYSEWIGPERRSKLAGRSSKAYYIAAACSATTSTPEVI